MKPYYTHNGIEIYHGDCMLVLHSLGRQFDLCLTDPPYGIVESNEKNLNREKKAAPTDFGHFDWDEDRLPPRYIDMWRRYSTHQIIFGGNYYADNLDASMGWIIWDKDNTGDFADCELAWTSFDRAARIFKWRWNGMLQEDMGNKEPRVYPTQKPVPLMKWVLDNYTEKGWSIVDPCMGGGSTLIAAKEYGHPCVGIDQEERACEIAAKRLSQEVLTFD